MTQTDRAVSLDSDALSKHGPFRSGKRRAFAVSCVLAIIVGTCFAWYQVVSHSRFRVVSATDPATGYHIEYTVSTRFRSSDVPRTQVWFGFGEKRFSPATLLPPAAWIRDHILSIARQTQTPLPVWDPDIHQYAIRGTTLSEAHFTSDGFVEASVRSGNAGDHRVERTLTSGCPTTFVADDGTYKRAGKAHFFRTCKVVVRPRDQPVAFMFTASSDDKVHADDQEREMRAIRDSIRVVKGKQVSGVRY
jgi:hypothetical protein